MQRRRVREPTNRDKEIENKPICVYDPLGVRFCDHYLFPPPDDVCLKCLKGMFAWAEDAGEALRFYLATIRFFEKKIEKLKNERG